MNAQSVLNAEEYNPNKMDIVRFASHPIAGNAANDPDSLSTYYEEGEYLQSK